MKTDKTTELFDVVAVNLETDKVRLIAIGKTENNADAIENMAVMRRGCGEEFFAVVPSGRFTDGDDWKPISAQ